MVMSKKDIRAGQAMYLGRWVDKSNFRAFVYNNKGEQKLANSYAEFESLTSSGLWLASKPDASPTKRRLKDGADS